MRFFIGLCFALLCVAFAKPQQELKILRIVPFGNGSLKITFNQPISPQALKQRKISSRSALIDIQAVLTVPRKRYIFPDRSIIRVGQQTKKITRIVIEVPKKLDYEIRIIKNDCYLQLSPKTESKKTQFAKISTTEDKKRIVIDAGHGGKDCGALGVLQVCEKVITLNIAKLLEQELKKRGYTVFLTRTKDQYLGLRERTNFANSKNADLFISIHANSVPKRSSKTANGVETYFLSTARSERARRVAEKENRDSIEVMNYFSKQTFLNFLNTHRLIASNKLAIDIQGGILRTLQANYSGVLDGGVREGPFWVLAGALMPSVLIEIGYISHPQEGRRINHKDYQKLLVQGIADGIKDYFLKNP